MALTCRNVQHLHDAYIDEELSAALTAEVQAHLLQCPECQRQIELMRTAGAVIAKDRREPALPREFAGRIVAALPDLRRPELASTGLILTRRQRRRIFFERFVTALTPAAAAIIVVSALIWPTAPSSSRSPAPSVVLGEREYGPVDLLGVRAMVDPTMATLANTERVTDNLQGLYRMSVNDARIQSRPAADGSAESPFSSVLFMELLRPFSEMTSPLPVERAPAEDGVVRF